MRAHVVSIVWHNKEPVFGVDTVATDCGVLVATGGADRVLRLWRFCDGRSDGRSDGTTAPAPARPAGVTYLCGFARHNGAVNAVRFAPVPAPPAEGDTTTPSSTNSTNLPLLATASDDGYAIVWRCTGAPDSSSGGSGGRFGGDAEEDSGDGAARVAALGPAERALLGRAGGWRQWKLVKAPSDVYDLCWSADGRHLAGATTENSVFVAAVATGAVRVVREHTHFVQGVAWDPLARLLVSQSSDQTLRVYATPRAGAARPVLRHVVRTLHHHQSQSQEADGGDGGGGDNDSDSDCNGNNSDNEGERRDEGAEGAEGAAKAGGVSRRLFRSEAAHTFFRRLCWSPDGSLLVAPAGMFAPPGAAPDAPVANTAYVFARGALRQPFLHLPGHRSVVVAARFSPLLYRLRDVPSSSTGGSSGSHGPAAVPLPYRMVFAVASLDAVVVYDTQAWHAVAAARRLHLAAITDLAWTPDGQHVLVASRDGFCSVLSFAPGELGAVLPPAEHPPVMADIARARAGTLPDETPRRRPKSAAAAAAAPAPPVPAPPVPAPVATAATTKAAAPSNACEQPKRKRIRPMLIPPGQDGST